MRLSHSSSRPRCRPRSATSSALCGVRRAAAGYDVRYAATQCYGFFAPALVDRMLEQTAQYKGMAACEHAEPALARAYVPAVLSALGADGMLRGGDAVVVAHRNQKLQCHTGWAHLPAHAPAQPLARRDKNAALPTTNSAWPALYK